MNVSPYVTGFLCVAILFLAWTCLSLNKSLSTKANQVDFSALSTAVSSLRNAAAAVVSRVSALEEASKPNPADAATIADLAKQVSDVAASLETAAAPPAAPAPAAS